MKVRLLLVFHVRGCTYGFFVAWSCDAAWFIAFWFCAVWYCAAWWLCARACPRWPWWVFAWWIYAGR